MFLLYLIALLWFCRRKFLKLWCLLDINLDGKKVCLPEPDSIFHYKRRLKYLKRGEIETIYVAYNIFSSGPFASRRYVTLPLDIYNSKN